MCKKFGAKVIIKGSNQLEASKRSKNSYFTRPARKQYRIKINFIKYLILTSQMWWLDKLTKLKCSFFQGLFKWCWKLKPETALKNNIYLLSCLFCCCRSNEILQLFLSLISILKESLDIKCFRSFFDILDVYQILACCYDNLLRHVIAHTLFTNNWVFIWYYYCTGGSINPLK